MAAIQGSAALKEFQQKALELMLKYDVLPAEEKNYGLQILQSLISVAEGSKKQEPEEKVVVPATAAEQVTPQYTYIVLDKTSSPATGAVPVQEAKTVKVQGQQTIVVEDAVYVLGEIAEDENDVSSVLATTITEATPIEMEVANAVVDVPKRKRRGLNAKKLYKCSVCQSEFTSLYNMKTHARTHTGEKPYQCSHCHRAFSDHSNFKLHMKRHQGEKAHKCSACGRGFHRLYDLNRHKACHGKTTTCPICGKTFEKPHGMGQHMKKHKLRGEWSTAEQSGDAVIKKKPNKRLKKSKKQMADASTETDLEFEESGILSILQRVEQFEADQEKTDQATDQDLVETESSPVISQEVLDDSSIVDKIVLTAVSQSVVSDSPANVVDTSAADKLGLEVSQPAVTGSEVNTAAVTVSDCYRDTSISEDGAAVEIISIVKEEAI